MCQSECLSNEPLKSSREYLCWDEDILGAKPELNYEYISNACSILGYYCYAELFALFHYLVMKGDEYF